MNGDKIYTVDALASEMDLTARTIRAKANSGELPAYKLFGKWYFIQSEIIEHIRKEGKPNKKG